MPPKKILIVEDEKDLRMLVAEQLKMAGYEVHQACDGEEGFAKAREIQPDLILSDVIMPKKSGTEAYEEIRKQQPAIRILFTSGYAADILNRKGIVEEDRHFISKPVPPDTFLRKIREVLDK